MSYILNDVNERKLDFLAPLLSTAGASMLALVLCTIAARIAEGRHVVNHHGATAEQGGFPNPDELMSDAA